MCEHEKNRIIATNNGKYTKQCLDCNYKWLEPIHPKKKTLLQKIFKK